MNKAYNLAKRTISQLCIYHNKTFVRSFANIHTYNATITKTTASNCHRDKPIQQESIESKAPTLE